ncbi:hypothetical protein JCM19236_5143 [Vibrio sp. JCM 19236]|nr:hypothetical protein JCM19236_5143 [Vibrio sp. JCM 19236]
MWLVVLNSLLVSLSSQQRAQTLSQISSIDKRILSLLGTLLLFAIIANLVGYYPIRGFIDLSYYLGLLLLCTTLTLNKHNKLIFELIALISALCFLSVFLGFVVSILYGDGETVWTILSYTNPRMMNQVQVWLIAPSLYLVLVSRSLKAWIPLLLNFALIFALQARGLAVASITGLLLWAVLDKKHRARIIKTVALAIALGYAIKWLFLAPFPAYILTGELLPPPLLRTSDSGRIEMWTFVFQHLSFWGNGGDAFACNSPFNARPHNSVLLVAFNWGILSAICFVALIAKLLIKVTHVQDIKARLWGITLLSGVAYSFISGVLDSPFSQLLALITIALFWQSTGPKARYKALQWQHLMLLLLGLLIASITTQRVLDRIDNNFFLAEEYIPEVYTPQFWFGNNCLEVEKRIQ